MAKQIGVAAQLKNKLTVKKRTSQGLKHKPKSKHARKNWKAYRGQGRP